MRILIDSPAYVATFDDKDWEFQGGHVLIDGNQIVSIGPKKYNGNVDYIINGNASLVLPGFINTHHHFFQSLTRNVPAMQNDSLFDWLTKHYKIWQFIDYNEIYISAKTALFEMMQSGVTCSSDHLYLFPKGASGFLMDAEIEAAASLGVRFYPTRGSMSLGESKGGLPPDILCQDEETIIRDVERVVKKYHNPSKFSMLQIAVAPCSPFNVSEDNMRFAADYCKKNHLQMHTHLAETLDEEKFCIQKYGKSPVDYMDSLAWLENNTWFAHSIHLNEDEINRMAKNRVGVSHCPSSNMRLGSGIAPIREMLDAGVNVSLAVDGSASNDGGNFLMEARQALLISRLREKSKWLDARDVLRMATRGGAEVLGRDDIGQLAQGKAADIAIFDLDKPSFAGGLSDPLAALIFTNSQDSLKHLIINGKMVFDDIDSGEMLNNTKKHNAISENLLTLANIKSSISSSSLR